MTDMATAPRRGSGSGEGASLTASVAALLRVPGGAEVRGFGVRERLMALTVHARQGPGIPPCTGKKTQREARSLIKSSQVKSSQVTVT